MSCPVISHLVPLSQGHSLSRVLNVLKLSWKLASSHDPLALTYSDPHGLSCRRVWPCLDFYVSVEAPNSNLYTYIASTTDISLQAHT